MSTFLSIALPVAKFLPELADRFDEILYEAVGQAIVDALPASDLDEFEKVIAEGDEKKVRAFLKARAPHVLTLIRERIGEARQTLVSETRSRGKKARS